MLFPVIAVIVGVSALIIGYVVVKDLRANRPPPGTEPVPATTLQRTAFWGVIAGLVVIGAAVWMLVARGPEVVFDDDTMRLQFMGIVLTGIALFATLAIGVYVVLTRRARLDERDLAVLSRAPMVQGGLMLVTLAAWVIGLQETFRGQPGVPMTYLHLIFWSCLAANMLAWPIGILIGYRRT